MDDIYRARLSATPHPPGALHDPGMATHSTPQGGPQFAPRPDDIHIQPHHAPNATSDPHMPIPIQLPNIYVNPFPAHDHTAQGMSTGTGTRHRDGPTEPINVPTSTPSGTGTGTHSRRSNTIKIGPWRFTKPHPLLWICLALGLLALVLEVPKGSLPTLTGRHRALRASFISRCILSSVYRN